MLTCKFAFSASDSISTLKLIDAGIPRDHLVTLSVIMIPFGMIIPIVIAPYTNGNNILSFFLKGYIPRLIISLATALAVYYKPNDQTSYVNYYLIIFIMSLIGNFAMNVMFVSQMAFSKISDPTIGGTYMTLLNTVANLGSKWPQTLNLFLVDPLTTKTCIDIDNCTIDIDGYYILVMIGFIMGILWYIMLKNPIQRLENKIYLHG